MIDSDLVEQLEPEELRLVVKQCLASLHTLGIVQLQLNREKERLLSGDKDESDVDLAKSILAYRSKHQHLLMLDDIGQTYAREMTNVDS